MPESYYTSQYSGEEIDERLTAAHNAVRYDVAQTLTDEQKTQARENVNAAPGGYGLGGIAGAAISSTVEEGLNTATQNGWYYFGGTGGIENRPSLIPDSGYGYLLVSSRDQQTKLQVFMSAIDNYIAVRKLEAGVWQPWEYLNPPMQIGVEYRTTERYLGKPVYVKVVDCGNLPASGLKNIAHGIANCKPIHVYGEMSNGNTLPYTVGTTYSISADGIYIQIYVTGDFSQHTVKATIKYTKTTD